MTRSTMLRLHTTISQLDSLQGWLFLAGAEGVETRDHSTDKSIPKDRAQLLTYGDEEAMNALASDLEERSELVERPEVLPVQEIDWAEAWKVHFKALRLSPRLAVVPSWEDWPAPEGVHVIRMDPGSAFGTGQHATTALCLRALDQIAASGGIGSLADIGCGTGILAIGADLLGAGPIWMVDNDPLAVTVAAENLDNMGMRERVVLECQDEPSHPRRFDTLVANILAPVLIRLAARLSACVTDEGCLLLSGLLYSQIDEVESEYLALGWRRAALSCEGEWALLWLRR
jgi:ribosomal protein L11 methyltransferase